MEKGKKNSFMRRFFTLMLAFVTMLSSMGIGSLGVEIAQVIQKHSLASILTSFFLIVAVFYTAWLVVIGG